MMGGATATNIMTDTACLGGSIVLTNGGAASAPHPAVHCHPRVLLARSASTSVSQNQRAPSCQGISRFLVSRDATIMRTRLCIQPVCQSSRMPASTMGMPVRPRRQRSSTSP